MDSSRLGQSPRLVDRFSARRKSAAFHSSGSCQSLHFPGKLEAERILSRISHKSSMNGDAAAEALSKLQISVPKPAYSQELDPLLLPEHVAIIMDGNTRWARQRGWGANKGHEAGIQALREIVKLSTRWGVKVLTVFAFSTENWLRPKMETEFLMQLFERVLTEDLMNVFMEDVSVHFIGDLSRVPSTLKTLALQVQAKTCQKKGLKLVVAMSYSGRQDITQACKALAADVKEGILEAEEIDEAKVREKLLTSWDSEIGDPDLVIRTSGEKRISNFLLWQLAYSELVFVDELWPDFGEVHYKKALLDFQQRDRRFGKHK